MDVSTDSTITLQFFSWCIQKLWMKISKGNLTDISKHTYDQWKHQHRKVLSKNEQLLYLFTRLQSALRTFRCSMFHVAFSQRSALHIWLSMFKSRREFSFIHGWMDGSRFDCKSMFVGRVYEYEFVCVVMVIVGQVHIWTAAEQSTLRRFTPHCTALPLTTIQTTTATLVEIVVVTVGMFLFLVDVRTRGKNPTTI